MRIAIAIALALGLAVTAPVMAARSMTLEDLSAFHRVSDPQPSPDGQWIVYVVADVEYAENRTNSDLWIVPTRGGTPRQLTRSPKHDRHPRWSPDGKWTVFESNRAGDLQLYTLPITGGEAQAITTISTEAGSPVWSPDGKRIAFVSAVYPEFSEKPFAESDKANRDKQKARDNSKVKGRVIEQLLYRHWDSWVDDKRQHLFVVPVSEGPCRVRGRSLAVVPARPQIR